jgi:hypothetical protein
MSDVTLRLNWITLAAIVALVVGGINRWITPQEKLHGGLVYTLLGGYGRRLSRSDFRNAGAQGRD